LIAFLTGRVAAVGPDTAVLEVGGVGMAVQCTPGTVSTLRVGEQARLSTSLVVREDSLTLYGFADDDERSVFELLQSASGVGPRLAQAMLAVHAPDELRRAVATEDLRALELVPGIGRKGAQRIVLELRDKLGAPHGGPTARSGTGGGETWREQVHAGLVALGWSPREADEALVAIAPDALAMQSELGRVDVGALLKAALRTLSRA
jgi:Holliday junction DNA helicase RuvA